MREKQNGHTIKQFDEFQHFFEFGEYRGEICNHPFRICRAFEHYGSTIRMIFHSSSISLSVYSVEIIEIYVYINISDF